MKHIYFKILIITILTIVNSSLYSQNDIEVKIKDKLPKNVLLREYEKISDAKVDSYVGIYVVNPVLAKAPNIDEFCSGFYCTCPEQTLGQTITGIYHLFLFQDNSIKSDIIIPPAYSENNSMEQELCYYNTECNLCWYFGDYQNCEGKSKTNLQKAKLINLKDCTSSGKKHDFVLVGPTEACGFVDYLVAGYNDEANKVEIFDIKDGDKLSQWHYRFYPDEQGEAIVEFLCGDHGNETYSKYTYRFNRINRKYELVETIEKSCD